MSNLTPMQKRELEKKGTPFMLSKDKYTIGEIHRLGLLNSHTGEPYKDKGTISKELRGQPYEVSETVHGPAKLFSLDVIHKLNKRWE